MIATAELGETTSMPSFFLRSMNVTQTSARGDENGPRIFACAQPLYLFAPVSVTLDGLRKRGPTHNLEIDLQIKRHKSSQL